MAVSTKRITLYNKILRMTQVQLVLNGFSIDNFN